jgi:hypothetical protein
VLLLFNDAIGLVVEGIQHDETRFFIQSGQMDFAALHLTRLGWEQGQGLGRNKQGIKKPIGITHKTDTRGLGKDMDEWETSWWQHLYNSGSAGIQVAKDEEGNVRVETREKVVDKSVLTSILYSHFVKSQHDLQTTFSTQEELLEACGGRRLRTGARGIHLDSDEDDVRISPPKKRRSEKAKTTKEKKKRL